MTQIDIASIIAKMQQQETYPHSVSGSIKLVQTHISYLFLTGEYVYKLKKRVDFGFLDFSTLEKRKHFLEEEIRLNSQIAPDLYLEVLPIVRQGDKLILGGDGEAVEYALKMRQFPQKNLFINLFENNKLSSDRLSELGKKVARFHQQAKTNEYIRSFGRVAKIKQAIDENYQQTKKYIGTVQTQKQFDETKTFTDHFFSDRQELFQARIDAHKIKECHGDLHLKNICWWQNEIQLFDRIEFNEAFRFVDVMYDVAFTVMDLEIRDRRDLANVFLNTYLEYTGDWSGLTVLSLYLSRQAYVRAKTNSMLLDDEGVSEADKQQAKQTAADYYRQAWKYTKRQSGKLILMSGVSGTGKSTAGKIIARKMNAIQIRSDVVRKHLAGISLDEPGGDEIYTADMSQKTYNRLRELGIMLAKEGFTVILDAKYDRIALRQPVIEQAQAANIPLQIIHCIAPTEILRDRLSTRSGDVSDATPDLLRQQLELFEEFGTGEQSYVTTIDTSNDNWQQNLKFK
ncbi:AAA family ATPase [Myxosarcina sp. GI1]|uniref:bifunctional aminoglycoside phosphotransferase/ATP-binding protein n=1 Tax=Myxosarcina sp. GI1 TaxID=1541065 RepID=UPI000B27A7EA